MARLVFLTEKKNVTQPRVWDYAGILVNTVFFTLNAIAFIDCIVHIILKVVQVWNKQ